ncbi:MAG: hypothetical protein RMX65_022855 [Nostoc sp. DedQUE01]|nr:hypothetical protein [Nostoc sp. DedQUE01]
MTEKNSSTEKSFVWQKIAYPVVLIAFWYQFHQNNQLKQQLSNLNLANLKLTNQVKYCGSSKPNNPFSLP